MKYSAKILALICGSLSVAAWADWKQTGKGPYAYDDPANWTDGAPNGVFATTLTTDQTITFSKDTSIATLKVAFGGGKKYYFQRDPNAEGDVTLSIGALVYAPNQTKSSGALYLGSTEAVKNLTAVKFDTALNAAPTIDSKINPVYIYAPITGNGDLTVTPLASFLPNGTVTLDGTLTIAGTGAATFYEDVSAKAIAFTGTSNQLTFNKGVAVEETITLASAKNTIFAATSLITKGKLVVAKENTGTVYLRGENSYAGGTEVIGTGAVSADSSTAFGTGPVTFNAGTKLNASYDVTLENDNAFFFNDSFSFTGGKELDLGKGPITLAKPLKITCGGTLNLRGAFQGAYGVQDIEKDGKSTILRLYQDFTADPTKTVKVTQGYLELYGKMTGSSLKVTNSSGILRLHTAFDNDTLPSINITSGTVEVYSHLEQPETITTTGAGTLKICSDLEYDTLTIAPETGLLFLEGSLSGGELVFRNKVNVTVNGAILSGSVAVNTLKNNVYLNGDNTYAGGTDVTCAGDGSNGLLVVGSSTAFGTGEVRFNKGARLGCNPSTTIANANKYIFNATLFMSADGKTLNLGAGDVELADTSFTAVTVDKGTLAFDGEVVNGLTWLDFKKGGGGTLNLSADIAIPEDGEITTCLNGNLHLYGKVTASSIIKNCNGVLRLYGEVVLPDDEAIIYNKSGNLINVTATNPFTQPKLSLYAGSNTINFNSAWTPEGDLTLDVSGSTKYTPTLGNATISGGRLTKTGALNVTLAGTNEWTGGTEVREGAIIFNSPAPASGQILIPEGTRVIGSAACPMVGEAGLLALGLIDPASAGTLSIGANETGDVDLSGYPNLTFGCAVGASEIAGQLSLPAGGTLKLGDSQTMTFTSENALVGTGDVLLAGNVTFTAPCDYAGTITVDNGCTLTLSGPAAFPNAEIVTHRGTLKFLSDATERTILRAKKVTMKSGVIELAGAADRAATVNRIDELVLTTSETAGGTPNVRGGAGDGAALTLSIGTLTRPLPVMLNVACDGLGDVTKILIDGGLVNVGAGEPGTAAQPIVPWVRSSGHMAYYDGKTGVRLIDDATHTDYAESYAGAPRVANENASFSNSKETTYDFSMPAEEEPAVYDLTSIELLTSAGGTSFNRLTANNASIRLASGAMHVMSSNGSSTPPGSFLVTDGLDAGDMPFYMTYTPGYNNVVNVPLRGTGGMVIGDAQVACNRSKGFYLGGTGSTLTGDVHVFGSLQLGGTDVLPFGERSGDLYVHGNFYPRMVDVKVNAIFGKGIINYGNSPSITMTFGCDGSDGDFEGTITSPSNPLSLVKDGAGVQRLAGDVEIKYSIAVNAGTLQFDGLFHGTDGTLTVNANGRLTGGGESAKNVVVKGTLEPGSEGGKVFTVSNEKDLTFFDGSSFAVAVDADGSTNVKVAGAVVAKRVSGKSEVEDPSVEIPVVVTGSKTGRFKILEASDINATFTCDDKYKTLEVVSNVETGRKELWLTSASKSLLIIVR